MTELQGLDRHDHVCWPYAEVPDFEAAAQRFLLDGLERGERLLCLGDVAIRSATEGGSALPDAAELVRSGRLDLLPLSAVCGPDPGRRRSVREQLQFYSRAVQRALDDGFAGLRVAAEVTESAADDAHVACEQATDRFIADGPGMATMCAYRMDVLDDSVLERMRQVHPLVGGPVQPTTFQLFGDEGALVLTGEVDSFGADELRDRLRDAATPLPDVGLDVSELAFVDGAGASVLAAWAVELAGAGMTVEVRGASSGLRRVWELLDLPPVPFV